MADVGVGPVEARTPYADFVRAGGRYARVGPIARAHVVEVPHVRPSGYHRSSHGDPLKAATATFPVTRGVANQTGRNQLLWYAGSRGLGEEGTLAA